MIASHLELLGVPMDNICQNKALSQSDMKVLYVGSSSEWKGLAIEK